MLINLNEQQVKEVYEAVHDIEKAGGFGELIFVYRKGQIEFINHTIVTRFNQPEKENKNGN